MPSSWRVPEQACPHELRRWRQLRCGACLQIPVLVSDLDLECKMWVKIRMAPMCPYFGMVSLAFVGQPTIKVQLLPYNRVRLMRIPVLQARAPTSLQPGVQHQAQRSGAAAMGLQPLP